MQAGLCLCFSQTLKTGFLEFRPMSRSVTFLNVKLNLQSFSCPSIKCVLCAQKNHLIEMGFLSTHQEDMLWLRYKKNNFPLQTVIWRRGYVLNWSPNRFTYLYTVQAVLLKLSFQNHTCPVTNKMKRLVFYPVTM